jgi:hypothetical protein
LTAHSRLPRPVSLPSSSAARAAASAIELSWWSGLPLPFDLVTSRCFVMERPEGDETQMSSH